MFALRYCRIVEHQPVELLTFALFGVFAAPFVMFLLLLLTPIFSKKSVVVDFVPYKGNANAYGRFYFLTLVFSTIYLVLIVIDKILIGGVLSVGITEARYAAMAEGPRNSVVGALHYFLAGAPAILACLLLTRRVRGGRMDIFAWCIAVAGFGSFFLSGGRNSFVIGVVFVLFYIALERAKFRQAGDRETLKIPRWLKISVVLGACYVIYLFVERAQIRGTDMAGAMRLLSENYDVEIFTPSWLSGFLLQLYYCLAYLVFYLTHAPTYVSQYMEVGYSPMLMGEYGFLIIFRVFDILVGGGMVDSFGRLLIAGVYLTFPGTLYVDFGWVGVALSAFLLAIITVYMVTVALWKSNGAGLMAASLCLTIVALSPIFSGLSVGNGMSLLVLLPVLRVFGVSKKYI